MTLAIWDITTITSIAANTHFGIIGRWEEIPDMFPPIGFMYTSTLPATRAQANSIGGYGLYVEYQRTTSAGAPFFGKGTSRYEPRQVLSYVKGTRWFRIAVQIQDVGLPGRVQFVPYPIKRLYLYYRAVDEMGETPA